MCLKRKKRKERKTQIASVRYQREPLAMHTGIKLCKIVIYFQNLKKPYIQQLVMVYTFFHCFKNACIFSFLFLGRLIDSIESARLSVNLEWHRTLDCRCFFNFGVRKKNRMIIETTMQNPLISLCQNVSVFIECMESTLEGVWWKHVHRRKHHIEMFRCFALKGSPILCK